MKMRLLKLRAYLWEKKIFISAVFTVIIVMGIVLPEIRALVGKERYAEEKNFQFIQEICLRDIRGNLSAQFIPESEILKLHGVSKPFKAKDYLRDAANGKMCSRLIIITGNTIVLQCDTDEIDVFIRNRKMVLRRKFGPSVYDNDIEPPIVFAFQYSDLEEFCSGARPIVRGECAFHGDDPNIAETQFLLAKQGEHKDLALLRLGDLRARDKDYFNAEKLWRKIRPHSPEAQMAWLRLMELTGAAPDGVYGYQAYIDISNLPAPYAREMVLRAANTYLLLNKADTAAKILAEEVSGKPDSTDHICKDHPDICLRVCADAMRNNSSRQEGYNSDALIVCLSSPERYVNPLGWHAGLYLSKYAENLGAVTFAANIMASVTHLAPEEKIESHLWRSARLYNQLDDIGRRDVILDYAEKIIDSETISSERWTRDLYLKEAETGTNDAFIEKQEYIIDSEDVIQNIMDAISRADGILTQDQAH